MSNLRPWQCDQPYLLPPDPSDWISEDDIVHFIVEAVKRIPLQQFHINHTGRGSKQYHPSMMLALMIFCYTHGIFSSRKIERATYRDIAARYLTGGEHPDHDTICKFRRENEQAFKAYFLEVLKIAKETGILKIGTVSIDGTHMRANANKTKTIEYARAKELSTQLEIEIDDILKQAEQADCNDGDDGQRLPEDLSRRQKLKAKMDAACETLEQRKREAYAEEKAEYDKKKDARDEREGKKGSPPAEPSEEVDPAKRINLTDDESTLSRKSNRHAHDQIYNCMNTTDADGSQLILSAHVGKSTADSVELMDSISAIPEELGEVQVVLGDCGCASEENAQALAAKGIDAYLAISRGCDHQRTHDFRPKAKQPKPKPLPKAEAPWRIGMRKKLQSTQGKALYRKRKHTVETNFGILKSGLGMRQFLMRGFEKVDIEWQLGCSAVNTILLHNLHLKQA